MTTPQPAALPEPELGYIKTDKSNQPAFSARQMRAALQPQPAAAAVSDERQLLREIVENHAESLQALGDELRQRGVTQISYYGPQAEVVAKSTQLIDRARALLALRPAHQTTDVQQRLFQLLNGAAGDGLIINDIDAAELFTDLFPEHIEFVTRGGVSPTQPAAQATPEPVGEVKAIARVPSGVPGFMSDVLGGVLDQGKVKAGDKLFTHPAPGVPDWVQHEIAAAQAKGGEHD